MRFIVSGGFSFGKCENIWNIGHFSGRLPPDFKDNARVATTGLGSIGF